MIEKKRLDVLVFERGLAPSREKARALIMAGLMSLAFMAFRGMAA